MVCVSMYVWPCLQSFLKESPATTADDAHCENLNVCIKDASNPLMPESCWALTQRGLKSPSPSLMLYIVTWTLKQYCYIPECHKIHHSSKPFQDMGQGVIFPSLTFPKLSCGPPKVLRLIITYYHWTPLGKNEHTQNISTSVSNCFCICSNKFSCRKRNYLKGTMSTEMQLWLEYKHLSTLSQRAVQLLRTTALQTYTFLIMG